MRQRVAVVAALGTTQLLAWASTYYLPGVLAVSMARDVRLSAPWIYAALSLGMCVSAALGPGIGRRIDLRGGRAVLCASSVLFAMGLCLLANAVGPVTLIVAWLVIGVAMAAGLYEAAFASLTSLHRHDSLNSITGLTLVAGFASTVGWPTSAYLEHRFGWRGACLTWAALHLFVGLPLNAWALRSAGTPNHETGATVNPVAQPTPRRDEGMYLLTFMMTASGMVSIGLAANLPRLFEVIGAAPAAAIAAASLIGPIQVAARLLEFGARRRTNPLRSALIASALHPFAALAVVLGGVPLIAAFTVLHGAGTGMMTITRGTLPLALFGPEGYGARIGKISAPARIGQALAPFLFGLLLAKFGSAALGVTSALSIAAIVALSQLRLPHHGLPKVESRRLP